METRMIGSLVFPIGSISLRYVPVILCTLDNLTPLLTPLLTLMVVYPHTSMVHSFLPCRHTTATADSLKTLRTKPEEQPTEAR